MTEGDTFWLRTWSVGVLSLVVVVLSLLAALVERSGSIRLRHWAQEAGGRLSGLYEEPLRFEAFRFVLSWGAKVATGALALLLWGALRVSSFSAGPVSLSVLALLALLLALAEGVSRALVGHDPEAALRRLTPFYRWLAVLTLPLIELFSRLLPRQAVWRREEADEDDVSDEEIEAFIRVGAREGILDPGEELLLRGIVDFGDKTVKNVMTPRIDVVGASVDVDVKALRELFLEARHSRLPLYRGSIDSVVGVVHLRDLVEALGSSEPVAVEAMAKPSYFVPETKRLGQLLQEFQARHLQMAVVVDEYGGMSGLVTVDDLVEEIVGDLPGEYEDEMPLIEHLPDGSWRFDGRVHLDEIEEVLGIDLGDADVDTLGGLIFAEVGDLPDEGQSLETIGLSLTVERVAQRRILSVRVRPLEPPAEADDA